jgi:hypothetical protein
MRTQAACLTLVLLAAGGGARAGETGDLRDLSVGVSAAALPAEGYAGFACAADPAIMLDGWQDWRRCPADPAGRRAIRFRYREGETMVGGHPVRLVLSIDPAARVSALHIETDPAAPPYLRKKAFLLGLQAKARYGPEGWRCSEATPDAQAQPIGDAFVAERCEKRLDDRHVIVVRQLFRNPGASPQTFVNATRIDIVADP